MIKNIFIKIFFIFILLLGGLFLYRESTAQGICNIPSRPEWLPENNVTLSEENPRTTSFATIDTVSCKDKWLRVEIWHDGYFGNILVFSAVYEITSDSVRHQQEILLGDEKCSKCDLDIYAWVYEDQSSAINNDGDVVAFTRNRDHTSLTYDNVGENDSIIEGLEYITKQIPQNEDGECIIFPKEINLINREDGTLTPIPLPTSASATNLNYSDENRPEIRVTYNVVGCAGLNEDPYGPMMVINSNDSYTVSRVIDSVIQYPNVTNQGVVDFHITYKVGEVQDQEDVISCLNGVCKVIFLNEVIGHDINEDNEDVEDYVDLSNPFANAIFNGLAHLQYNCDGECDRAFWEITGKSFTDEQGQPIDIKNNPLLRGYLDSIKDSPCYIPPTNPDDPSDLGKLKEDCYDLLAPLPGLVALGVPVNPDNDAGLASGAFTADFSLGFWINRIIMVLIGVIGLAAVIMIIVSGIQYMTTDIIGNKSGAKDRIVNSLIGVAISLSIFIILNTINPNLLDIDPEIVAVENIQFVPNTGFVVNVDVSGMPVSESYCGDPEFKKWAKETMPPLEFTDITTGQTYELFACDEENMVRVSNIDGSTGQNTLVHKSLVRSVNEIGVAYRNHPNKEQYPIISFGGYCCRMIKDDRGRLTNPPRISNHAYGVAIDINADKNRLISNPRPNIPRSEYTDMPQWFIDIWTGGANNNNPRRDWGWGGNWNSSKDAMHFSKEGREGGNERGDLGS